MHARPNRAFVLGLCTAVTGSAAAQPDLLITVDNFAGDNWRVSAEFNQPGFDITQIWIDAQFDLTGDGSEITVTDYNPSYDTTLGDATVINGSTASFRGFASSFFGVADPSNPLDVIEFGYAGDFDALELTLVGLNQGLFSTFPADIRVYQNEDGSPGLSTFGIQYIPAPGTAGLLAASGLLASRRRR